MNATATIEMTGTIDRNRQFHLDGLFPIAGPRRVRVLFLAPEDQGETEWSESEWLQAASGNASFAFLNDPAEDIYTVDDGVPFHDSI